MKPKRILIFSTAYYPFIAGAEVAIKEITDRLSGDFEFDLITAKMWKDLLDTEKIGTVNIYRIGIGIPLLDKLTIPIFGTLKAWKLQKRNNYFCYWAIMATYATGPAYIVNIARRFLGRKKIPIILTIQEGTSELRHNLRWGGLIALSWKLALRQTQVLTGISNFLLNKAKKNGYKGKMVLIPNGVNLKVFSKQISNKTKEELKNQFGKKTDDIFLVTTSRLEHKNATDDIISALTYLPENVKLLVIGSGALKVQLQKQADKLKVRERVKFLGFISHENIPEYFSICDIFIRPSRSEGFGNSFIEAMAAGLPVIATPVGGIVDFIDDKETGVFCSPDNPQSIARAVDILLDDSHLREHIIEKAKARVIERYSWDYIAQEMKSSIFDKLDYHESR